MLVVDDLVYVWLNSIYFGVPVNSTHSFVLEIPLEEIL